MYAHIITMTYKECKAGANDATSAGHGPNDYQSNIAAARLAKLAAEKAKKEAADRAASEVHANAARNAQDLEACRAEIVTLKAQLQESQRLVETTRAEAKSGRDALQADLDATSRKLANRESESQRLNEELSTAMRDKRELQSEMQSKLSSLSRELENTQVRMRDTLNQCERYASQMDNGDVTVREIYWGGRDLTNDGNIVYKVKERVRNGWGIPLNNDFFGCDPQHGTRKSATVRFVRSMRVSGWEGEEPRSVP